MATVKVALYNGNIDSLKKQTLPVHWNKGSLSIIRLPTSRRNPGVSRSDSNEATILPVEYHDSYSVTSNFDPSSEYGLFFYSSPIPPSHLKTSSLSSINATGSRIQQHPGNIYDELPNTSGVHQDIKINSKVHNLKHSKSKEKHKSSKSSSSSPVSNNDFVWETHLKSDSLKPFLLLPLYPIRNEKAISSFMSPVQCLQKSFKAGIHYPKWVECFIIFHGYFNTSQSIFSLLTTEAKSVFNSQPKNTQPTKMSLKQKLFGNRQKRYTPENLNSTQNSEFPLMIGFPNNHAAQIWWERINNILTQKNQTIHSAPSTQHGTFFAKDSNENNLIVQKCTDGENDLDGSYASLPLRTGQSEESVQSTGQTLATSDKIQRVRASKKNMFPNMEDFESDNHRHDHLELQFSSTLLTDLSTGETPHFHSLSMPSSFLLQVMVPYGLRFLIKREQSLVQFDILTTSIVRYSFFEDVFLIELGEYCLLSPDKELIFKVNRIKTFEKLFKKLASNSSLQSSSDEYSFTNSLREPPKPQLTRHLNRSSMLDDTYDPENNVYAELNRPQPTANSAQVDEEDRRIVEHNRLESYQRRLNNEDLEDEDPYNEGIVNDFL